MKKKLLIFLGIFVTIAVATIAVVVVMSNSSKKEFEVKFVVDEKTIHTETYTKDDLSITEPAVPSKKGYTGKWEAYTLTSGDIEVKAVYTPIEYKAVFKIDDSIIETVTYTIETKKLVEPSVPKKSGYTGKWEDYTLSTGDIVIQATYQPIEYKVSFVVDEKEVKSETYTISDMNIDEPVVPEKPGYTGKWETYQLSMENIVVHAIYTPIDYTVTFKVDDQVVEILAYTIENTNIQVPLVPEKTGYIGKWNVFTLMTGNIEVQAIYTPIEYKIEFKADENVVETLTYTVENTNIQAPAVPEKTGYTGKWDTFTLTTGNIEVQAIYTPIKYSITFKVEDQVIKSVTYTIENTNIQVPNVPEKAGYTGKWEGFTLTTGNIEVQAVYEAIAVNVTFVLNYEGASNQVMPTVNGKIDFIPERAGYQFNGWWISSGMTEDGYILSEKFDTKQVITENGLVLYAEWVKMPTDDKQLQVPSVTIHNNVFQWEKVERAESYHIVVTNAHSNTAIFDQTITELSWELPASYEASRYTIRVRANGNGLDTINSEYVIKYYKHNILESVTGFQFDIATSVLTWNEVMYAEGYNVYIENELIECIPTNSYDFSNYQAGYHYVKVEAVKTDWISGNGTISFEKKRLATPTLSMTFNQQTGKYVFSWNEISYANEYYISINGTEFVSTINRYTLENDATCIQNVHQFEVFVRAFDNTHNYFVSFDSEKQTMDCYYKVEVVLDDGCENPLMNDTSTSCLYATYDSSIKVQVSKVDGYNFAGWWMNDVCQSTNLEYQFTLKQHTKLQAKTNYFTLTTGKNYDDAGKITEYSNQKISVGSKIELQATTWDGYNFIGWFINNELVSSEMNYAYTMKEESVVIVATYDYYTVTTSQNSQNAGTIIEYSNKKIQVGKTVEVVATVNNGYRFLGWYIGDTCVSIELTYTFTMKKENVVLVATYEVLPATLVYVIDGVACYQEEYTNESPITNFKNYETITEERGKFFGWYKDQYFSTNNAKVTSTLELSVDENNCAYVYGAISESKYFIYYEYNATSHSYAITAMDSSIKNATITSLAIPSSFNHLPVKTLDYTCQSNSTITEVIVSEGIETIERSLVERFSKLKNIYLPSTLKGIKGGSANVYPSCLEKVYYSGSLVDWCNIQFAFNKSNPMSCAEEFYLHNEFQSILLTTLSIPKGIETVGEYQFSGFECLQSVVLGENISAIDAYAFYECPNLTSILIPSNIKEINDYAFSGCSNLSSITFERGSQITSIGHNAFAKCAITTICIPTSVEKMGVSIFENCKNLTTLDFEQNSKLKEFPKWILNYCSNITNITIPNITSCAEVPFFGEKPLSVYYQGSLTDWFELYENCQIRLTNHCEHFYVFENNAYEEVTALHVPETVTSIKDNIFNGYKGINQIILHENVTSIGANAFYNTSIKEVAIPKLVSTIGETAFGSCTALKEVTIANIMSLSTETPYFKYVFGNSIDSITTVKILDGIVPEKAFDGLLYLEHLTIPYINNPAIESGTLLGYMFGTEKYADAYLQELSQSTHSANGGEYTYYVPTRLVSLEILGGKIMQFAMQNFKYIEELTIGENVEYIDESIAIHCTALRTIHYYAIEAQTKTVYGNNPPDVFPNLSYGSGIATVTIGEKVKTIPEYLFYNDNLIQTISIPEASQLEIIGKGAFVKTCITNIVLPKTVKKVGKDAFLNCESLQSLHYLGDANDWCQIAFENEYANPSINEIEIWFDLDGTSQQQFDSITLSNISSIGAYQFIKFTNLTTISIQGVTSIGKDAFNGCRNITALSMDTVAAIGEYAFNGCSKITTLSMNSVTTIGEYAFAECSSITKIMLPNTIQTIGANAFSSDTSAADVYYDGSLSDWCTIQFENESANPIYCAANLYAQTEEGIYQLVENIEIPTTIHSIGQYAFNGFEHIQVLRIPQTVTSIGMYAFANSSFEYVYYNIPNLISNNNIFNGTEGELVIEKSVVSISNYLFRDSKFTSIRFEENSACQKIGKNAFYNNTNLTAIHIPESVITMGESMFSGCENLTTLEIPFVGLEKENTTVSRTSLFGIIFGSTSFNQSTRITQNYSEKGTAVCYIPNSLTNVIVNGDQILDYSFNNLSSIVKVTLGTNIKSIGKYAFSDCINLQKIDLPTGLRTIGEEAFLNCGLQSIVIGANMTSIGNRAFFGCTKLYEVQNLSTLNIVKGDTNYGYVAYYALDVYSTGESAIKHVNDFLFYVKDTTVELIGWTRLDKELTLPNDYEGVVYTIAANAFRDNQITTISFPNTFTEIPSNTFKDFTTLTTVNLPNTITRISDGAFSGCTSLSTIQLPTSLESIGTGAFAGCTQLIKTTNNVNYIGKWAVGVTEGATSISFTQGTIRMMDAILERNTTVTTVTFPSTIQTIPYAAFKLSRINKITLNNELTYIGEEAFYRCDTLTSITIPSKTVKIGKRAFYMCSKLQTVSFSSTSKLEGIEAYAFKDCSSLTKIDIPDSVVTLGESAFAETTALTTVTIGSGLTCIPSNCFYGCTSLSTLTIGVNVDTIGDSALEKCTALSSIVIPKSVTFIGVKAFYETKVSSISFEDSTSKWTVNGKEISVSNTRTNSTNLRMTYSNYKWTKKI